MRSSLEIDRARVLSHAVSHSAEAWRDSCGVTMRFFMTLTVIAPDADHLIRESSACSSKCRSSDIRQTTTMGETFAEVGISTKHVSRARPARTRLTDASKGSAREAFFTLLTVRRAGFRQSMSVAGGEHAAYMVIETG